MPESPDKHTFIYTTLNSFTYRLHRFRSETPSVGIMAVVTRDKTFHRFSRIDPLNAINPGCKYNGKK
jgi:hypothetical protein